jgi:flagellar motor switch protein FliN/FliY
MNTPRPSETVHHEFTEVIPSPTAPSERLAREDLKNVRLTIPADLGHTELTVRDILDLKEGSVIPLNKFAGETTDIYVNGIPLAKGEVVVMADALHVRVEEVLGVSPEEKETADGEA